MTESQKSNPLALKGMVTSPNHLASEAGLDVLRRGGNAIDATITACAVLAVVYPQMCTLGGDAFWLIYEAGTGKLHGLNASGRSALKANREIYAGRKEIPARGWHACITVPGVVSGWDKAFQLSRSMGSPLSWENLLEEAIAYAEDGFPISTSLAFWYARDTAEEDRSDRCLQRFPGFAHTYLPEGRTPVVGDVLRQPDLAATLRSIARNGAAEFYEGSIAQAIARDMRANGGLLDMEDFARHRADWVDPIHGSYRGYDVCNLPPNTQGMASVEILNILDRFDVSALKEGSADYCHLLVEATRAAFQDRDRYLTDPAFADIPLAELLSAEHADELARRISMQRVGAPLGALDSNGDTIWMGCIDRFGNAVSVIQSVYHDFGSGIVPTGTGILLQNRGCFFSLDPRHVNRLEPGKRSFHTLNPAMLLRNGRPALVYGTMGGEGQPQTQAAVVTRIIDFGMSPQEAIDAPRWLLGRAWGKDSNDLKVEARLASEVIQELARRGHPVRRLGEYDSIMGHAGAILVNQKTGVLQGATDPRSDGAACGW